MSTLMKLWEIAGEAVRLGNARMAHGLMVRLCERHGLNYAGCREFLESHGVDWGAFAELADDVA